MMKGKTPSNYDSTDISNMGEFITGASKSDIDSMNSMEVAYVCYITLCCKDNENIKKPGVCVGKLCQGLGKTTTRTWIRQPKMLCVEKPVGECQMMARRRSRHRNGQLLKLVSVAPLLVSLESDINFVF